MATTLGGVTLPAPLTPTRGGYDFIGGYDFSLSGVPLVDEIDRKRYWELEWEGLTASEKDTVMGVLLTANQQSFSPPDEDATYTVIVDPTNIEVTAKDEGVTLYDIKAKVREV